jgi:peptidyl-prolyl cis-trans isomerase D
MVRRIYLAESLGVVKTNDESIIFENGDKYTIAVLTEISEEGVAPINQVASEIKRILVQKKKAELLTKELANAQQGSESLLSVAQKVGGEIKEATNINFASFQVPGAGIEPKVIAAASLLEEGKLSAPIAGNQGVYIITVNTKSGEEITPEAKEQIKMTIEQTNLYRANYQAVQAIIENGNIVDQRYKFY